MISGATYCDLHIMSIQIIVNYIEHHYYTAGMADKKNTQPLYIKKGKILRGTEAERELFKRDVEEIRKEHRSLLAKKLCAMKIKQQEQEKLKSTSSLREESEPQSQNKSKSSKMQPASPLDGSDLDQPSKTHTTQEIETQSPGQRTAFLANESEPQTPESPSPTEEKDSHQLNAQSSNPLTSESDSSTDTEDSHAQNQSYKRSSDSSIDTEDSPNTQTSSPLTSESDSSTDEPEHLTLHQTADESKIEVKKMNLRRRKNK